MRELRGLNLAETLDRAALLRPNQPSISYVGQEWTVEEAAVASRKLAQLLVKTGVCSGDRVMIISRNSPYHLILLAACARIGAIMVPVSSSLTRFEVQKLVEFCAPRAVVCGPEMAALGTFDTLGTLLHFVIDDDTAAGPLADSFANGYLGLVAAFEQEDGEFRCDGEETPGIGTRQYPKGSVLMQFVAGEASLPKAVALTHENLFWAARNMQDELYYNAEDVTLVISPMSNGAGLGGGVATFFASGGHVVLCRRFEPSVMVRLIEDHQVTVMFAVPTVYQALLEHIAAEGGDLSSLRLPLVGGATVPVRLIESLTDIGLRPLNVWGTTHMAGPGIYMPHEVALERPGAIGHPFPYIQARIVDPETFEDVEPGEVGELLVRGPSVVTSFWHADAYNETGFVEDWLRTGDLVVASGPFMTMVAHRLDRIVTGGVSIYPSEVENILEGFPGATDVAVWGVPDALWGEIVVAGIVLDENAEVPELSTIQEFCAQKLAAFKLPRLLLVLPSIPRDEAGNVRRDVLRDLATSPSMPKPEPFPITSTVPVVEAEIGESGPELPPTPPSLADL